MAALRRRLQVLLDEDRYRRLELRSRETGAPVGALVREAIDVAFPGVETDREQAIQRLLDAEPIDVGDWEDVKREIDTMWERYPGA